MTEQKVRRISWQREKSLHILEIESLASSKYSTTFLKSCKKKEKQDRACSLFH
jgi:hypothetical protein